jgi:beta-lactamase superfamily II metal-dependent hydrolase
MKLKIFQSDKGDCLLLSAGTGDEATHVLVDGGMRASYTAHVAETISKLPKLDVVYVSHIDQDHISGVLQMVDDAFDWEVFQMRADRGEDAPRPKSFRPPKIGGVWHNAFRDQVDANDGDVADFLIASSNVASASLDPVLQQMATEHANLAASIPEAIQLSARIGVKQLGIKVNQGKGKLLMARKAQKPIAVGPMKFTILAPFPEDLQILRERWNTWLKTQEGRAKVKKMRAKATADSKLISSADDVLAAALEQAATLGDRDQVTAPNLASLMVLVEENDDEILLTGDGHSSDILKGLEQVGRIEPGGSIHVKVLKVQHHGSEHNIDADFCRRVTADHYVFCGNGAYTNPELPVIQAIFDSRVGPKRSKDAPDTKFRFWFNSHSSISDVPKHRKHMAKIEALVDKLAKKSGGRLTGEFLTGSSFPAITI